VRGFEVVCLVSYRVLLFLVRIVLWFDDFTEFVEIDEWDVHLKESGL